MSEHASRGHIPVMLHEVIAALPEDTENLPRIANGQKILVDMTFGGGGYSRAFLEQTDFTVLGLDRDPAAIVRGEALQNVFPNRLKLVETCFSDIDTALVKAELCSEEQAHAGKVVDAVVMDLGVSSFQLDEADRGFSFMHNGPLDMRMSRSGPSAADLVAEASEEELARIFWTYGEEKASRRIAKALVAARAEAPFTETKQLADAVTAVKPRRYKDRIHPATQVFQALRIAVNNELGEIEVAIKKAAQLLKPGGALIIVSFHSLEDRIVKQMFADMADKKSHVNKYRPEQEEFKDGYILPFKGVQGPTSAESGTNPRARSAKMRVLKRKKERAAA